MVSVRGSRLFTGNGPISLVSLSKLENRSFPVSVRDLVTIQRRSASGRVSAGDVSGEYKMTIYNTGDWFVSATLHDSGDIAGDSFVLEFILKGTNGVGFPLRGELGADETKDFGANGNDPFIRNNWELVSNNGGTAKLTVTPDVGTIIGEIAIVLIIGVAVVVFTAILLTPGTAKAQRCQDRPLDDHQLCVEFTKE